MGTAASLGCSIVRSTTTAARRNAASGSPPDMVCEKTTLEVRPGCSTGAPGAMAASRSVTAGSTSYLTRTRSAASSASYRLRARTTATGSPEYLTIPWASSGWVAESR